MGQAQSLSSDSLGFCSSSGNAFTTSADSTIALSNGTLTSSGWTGCGTAATYTGSTSTLKDCLGSDYNCATPSWSPVLLRPRRRRRRL